MIDYCAGNGGKTLALAAMLANNGTVVAHDVDERRLRQLEGSLPRAGATCVETATRARLQADPALVFRESDGKGGADCVLVHPTP